MNPFGDILLQAAIKYNGLGMAVHPIGFGSKQPLVAEWQNPPVLTVNDLKLCFEKRGDIITGVGFCSGFMSAGLCVLDFDENWQNSLEHFQHCWPELAYTPIYSTAHNRRQMIVRIINLPDSQTVTRFRRNNSIIELRANGANNVLPPSFHARCNKPYCTGDNYYEWLCDPGDLEFCEVDLPSLKTWLSEWGEIVEEAKEPIPETPANIGTIDRMIAGQEAPKAIETARKMVQEAQDGCKHLALLKAGGLLGGFVAVGVLEYDKATEILREEIDKKANVADYKLAYRTIENGLEWGNKRPFTAEKILTDKIEYAQQQDNNKPVIPPQITIEELDKMDLDSIGTSLDDLMTTDYPEPVWIVQDLLPVGLVFLAGKPKIGKSWLTLQMAGAIAKGNSFFGFVPPIEIPKIAVFALEDRPKRLKDRINKQGWYRPGLPVTFFTAQDFRTIAGDLRSPLARDALMLFLKKQGFRLVIIDTISRACFVDQLKNDVMAEILDPFQSFALNENVCFEFLYRTLLMKG